MAILHPLLVRVFKFETTSFHYFPQEFRISKSFGHSISGSGDKKIKFLSLTTSYRILFSFLNKKTKKKLKYLKYKSFFLGGTQIYTVPLPVRNTMLI